MFVAENHLFFQPFNSLTAEVKGAKVVKYVVTTGVSRNKHNHIRRDRPQAGSDSVVK